METTRARGRVCRRRLGVSHSYALVVYGACREEQAGKGTVSGTAYCERVRE